jgi:hypothetical protein
MPNAGARILATDTARWYCRGSASTVQTGIANATFTPIAMGAADDVDTLGIHDPVTNNTRFNIGLALGWWQVQGIVAWTTTTAAKRYAAAIGLNGSVAGVLGSHNYVQASMADAINTLTFAFVQATASTDYIEILGRHDLGVGVTTTTSVSGYRSAAHLTYLGT